MTTKKRTNVSAASRKVLNDFEKSVIALVTPGEYLVTAETTEYRERRYKRDRGRLLERIAKLEQEARAARTPAAPSKGLAGHLSKGDGAGF